MERNRKKPSQHPRGKAPARSTLRTSRGDPRTANVPTAFYAATGKKPGFPAERVVDLNYAFFTATVAGTGGVIKQAFRLNSAFDPDFTGLGGQPLGFDQWSLLYNHYVVEKATMTVMFDTYSQAPIVAGVYVSDDSTIPSDGSELIALGSDYVLIAGGSLPSKCVVDLDVARFFGRKAIASDSELRAATTANPTEQVFATVWTQVVDRLNAFSVGYTVKITYRVRFMEPRDLGPSLLIRDKTADATPIKSKDDYVHVHTPSTTPCQCRECVDDVRKSNVQLPSADGSPPYQCRKND